MTVTLWPKRIFIGFLCFLSFISVLFTQLGPAQSAQRLNRFDTYLAKKQPKQPETVDQFYKKAREVLPEEYYILYRIVDRLARANGLDTVSWRVRVDPTFDMNAYATEANLLVMFNGMLDTLRGDVDAVAWIMGHELAHHTNKHIAVKQAELALIQNRLEANTNQEIQQAMGAKQTNDFMQGVVGGVLNQFNVPAVVGIPILGGLFGQQESPEAIRQRQQAEAVQKMTALFHKQEYESDVMGYLYTARSGFKPEGPNRAIEVLSRLSVSDSLTHPSPLKRAELVEIVKRENPPEKLAQDGKAKLANNSKPLSYDLSKDGRSLLIWRDRGDIDNQFPT